MSLRNLAKQLASESAIYGISGVLTKFIAMFLIPIYTRAFTPNEYGKLSVVNTTIVLLTTFSILGLDSAASKWYWAVESTKEKNRVISTWFLCQLAVASVLGLSAALSANHLSILFFKSKSESILFIIASSILPLSTFTTIFAKVMRFRRKPIRTMVFTTVVSLLNIIAAISFVLIAKVGIVGFFIATLLATTVGAVWAWVELQHIISLDAFNLKLLKQMLKFSLPLIPTALGAWAISQSSIYILNFMRGGNEVGLFYIGNTIASLGGLFMAAFQQAWAPFAFSIEKQANAKNFYAVAFFLYVTIGGALAFLGSLFGKELLMILTTRSYSASATTISFLIFSYIAAGFISIASLGCNLAMDNRPVAVGVLLGALLSVSLNLLLDGRYGKNGAAIAILSAQVLSSSFVFYRAQRVHPIPYPFTISFTIFAILFISSLLGSLYTSMFGKLVFVVVLASLVFISKKKLLAYIKLSLQKEQLSAVHLP